MRHLVGEIFPDLDRDDISWEEESVSFEFLAIACLAQAAIANDWEVKCSSLPAGIRMDSWCRFPAHGFGRFGGRTRRCQVEELVGALTPRLVFNSPLGDVFSAYYQGFPPKDLLGERPDWLLVSAKTSVGWGDGKAILSLDGTGGKWVGRFGTLLGPYGPVERAESGVLTLSYGILEVSLGKTSQHLNDQISKYREIYGADRYVGFLARDVTGVEFPVVIISDLTYDACVDSGMTLFNLLLKQAYSGNPQDPEF